MKEIRFETTQTQSVQKKRLKHEKYREVRIEDRGLHEEGWVMGRKRMGRSDKTGCASRRVRYWDWYCGTQPGTCLGVPFPVPVG
jgi:hypothetical protein